MDLVSFGQDKTSHEVSFCEYRQASCFFDLEIELYIIHVFIFSDGKVTKNEGVSNRSLVF